MQELIKKFEKDQIKRKMPAIEPGDTVKVYQKIKEGDKERVQFFQGTVIRINSGRGMNGSFTVRKIASGVGVEKIFPFHLPTIVKLEVIKKGDVRRAKLYYLRNLQKKKSKLKEKEMTPADLEAMGFDEVKEKEAIRLKQEEENKKKAEAQAAEVAKDAKREGKPEAVKTEEVKKDTKKVEDKKVEDKTKKEEKK
jgi:large subunit ribosomal protein L19